MEKPYTKEKLFPTTVIYISPIRDPISQRNNYKLFNRMKPTVQCIYTGQYYVRISAEGHKLLLLCEYFFLLYLDCLSLSLYLSISICLSPYTIIYLTSHTIVIVIVTVSLQTTEYRLNNSTYSGTYIDIEDQVTIVYY